MTDDRIIRVLEEIRDLQRQHSERYGVRVILAFAIIAVILAVTMLVECL